jgi:RimJ/RimL family protein N-acetyltransferase
MADDKVVGQVTLYRRLHGWTRLVGYVLAAVRPDYRGRGIAGYLLRRIVEVAVQMGLDKLVAETLTGQRRERRILESVGFRKEAILRDHATDLRGNKHNIVLLSHNVYDMWRRMEDLILDKEFEVVP